jgi:hypothetical protein
VVGVDFEAVDGLQQLGFLVQQLLQHQLLLVPAQPGIGDLLGLLQCIDATSWSNGQPQTNHHNQLFQLFLCVQSTRKEGWTCTI